MLFNTFSEQLKSVIRTMSHLTNETYKDYVRSQFKIFFHKEMIVDFNKKTKRTTQGIKMKNYRKEIKRRDHK